MAKKVLGSPSSMAWGPCSILEELEQRTSIREDRKELLSKRALKRVSSVEYFKTRREEDSSVEGFKAGSPERIVQ